MSKTSIKNLGGFACWLVSKGYSQAVVKDMQSRLRRANRILPFKDEDVYLFYLSQADDFQECTISVRSQLRRAVQLYREYLHC